MPTTNHVTRTILKKREHVTFVPQWEGTFEQYARFYAHKNAWRVRWLMDEEDCVQQCAFVFAYCVNRYTSNNTVSQKVDNPKWFMSLFKRTLACEFHDLANKCTRQREAETEAIDRETFRGAGIDSNLGFLSITLIEASEELRTVLSALASAPRELIDLLLRESDDESWSRRISRLVGIKSPSNTVISELRTLLTSQD